MINLFFGFSGRLRRRDFILWSVLVPLVLIVAPALSVASSATSLKTSLSQDLEAAGLLWTFFWLIVLTSYITVALFWKRMNDVDLELQRTSGAGAGVKRWGYLLMTALNTAIVGANIVTQGQIAGSILGWFLVGLWAMACWQKPHKGPSEFGPDPRQHADQTGDDTATRAGLESALERAVAARMSQGQQANSPKLTAVRSAGPAGRPAVASFGKRKS